MPLGEVEVPYEGIVYQSLQHHAHEARLSHVVEPAEANRSTGKEGGVAYGHLVVLGGGHVFDLALFAYRLKLAQHTYM